MGRETEVPDSVEHEVLEETEVDLKRMSVVAVIDVAAEDSPDAAVVEHSMDYAVVETAGHGKMPDCLVLCHFES
jgi:ADP-ribose pyrophosphatase YjhB (NUDIX family)